MQGALFGGDAEDYLLCSQSTFNWDQVPPFVVGRVGYDNWLVNHAFHNANVSLIDATATVRTIHQTGEDGNFAQGGRNLSNHDYEYNRVLGKGQWTHGSTDHAMIITKKNSTGVFVELPTKNR